MTLYGFALRHPGEPIMLTQEFNPFEGVSETRVVLFAKDFSNKRGHVARVAKELKGDEWRIALEVMLDAMERPETWKDLDAKPK